MRTPRISRPVRWVAVLALAGAAALGGTARVAPAVGTSLAQISTVVEPDVDSDGLGDETQDADGGGLGNDTFDPDSLNFAWVGAWYADYDAGDALDPDV